MSGSSIFGPGLTYDVPPDERRGVIRTPALRDESPRTRAEIAAADLGGTDR